MPNPGGRALRRTLRIAIYLLFSLTAILACWGAVYQWAALRRDRRLNPPPGRSVDVGGYRLHIYCIGQGSPTVVLEAGLGDTWLAWYKVQPLISQFTRVCSYDRAGMGWSDHSPYRRTAKVMAEELHSLLQNAGIAGPYILVGHSFGGMIARMYATLHHEELIALVLVDSVSPYQDRSLPPELEKSNAQFLRNKTLKEDTMFLGIPRLIGWCGNGPPDIRAPLRTVDCRIGPWQEHVAEYDAREESSDQVEAAGSLGDTALVILSSDPENYYVGPGYPLSLSKKVNQARDVMQYNLSRLSTNSCRIIAKRSGHMIPLERPGLIADMVKRVAERSRTVHWFPLSLKAEGVSATSFVGEQETRAACPVTGRIRPAGPPLAVAPADTPASIFATPD